MRTAVMLLLFAHVSADAEAEPGWGTIGRGILTAGKYSVKGASYLLSAGSFGYTGYFLYDDIFGEPMELPEEYKQLENFLKSYQDAIRELKNSTLERAIEQKDNHKTQETVVINFMIVLVILFVVVFFYELKSYLKERRKTQSPANGEVAV